MLKFFAYDKFCRLANYIILFLLSFLSSYDTRAWGIRVDVNGIGNKVELKPVAEAGNEDLKNALWGDERYRKCNLFFQRKKLPAGKLVELEFSFIPVQSGKVRIILNGCWAKRPGLAQKDQEWVEYLKAEAKGAEIRNGDFSERTDNHKLKSWDCSVGTLLLEKGVRACNDVPVIQTITVKALQPVTIRLWVRDGGTVLATPSPPPISFKHKNWELLVDGVNGVWKSLKWQGELIASNPDGLPMFELSGQDTDGPRKLTESCFDTETGVAKIISSNGSWTFEEQISLGKRLKRELLVTFNGNAPAKFTNLNFLLYLPKTGSYYFPRALFGDTRHYMQIANDPSHATPCSGELAKMKEGEFVRGVSDCYFSFLQQSPSRTIMFAFDGRREPVRESFRGINGCVKSEIGISTAGWAMPGVPQRMGPCYIEVFNGDIQATLQRAPHDWYKDIGMLPPADRPDWVKDITSLWVFCPSPFYGGVNGALEALRNTIPYVKVRGANTFWILPLTDGFYGVIDYYGIRPDIGTKEDYKKLVLAAKKNDFHVWQDLVPHGGKPEYGKARGVSPFTVSMGADGQFIGRECFDYSSAEWRQYICNVASYYMKNFLIDGFRIDQCGFSPMNWRRPGFPASAPKNADVRWWIDAVANNGGKVPAVEGPRGSYSLREAGRILTGEIRNVVRKNRKDGAVLAETETLSCVPAGDAIFDFFIRRVGLKMAFFDGETSARELARYFDEQKFTDPPGTLRIRFLEVHDAESQRFTNWCGENGGLALRSAIFWSDGIPHLLANTDTGIGVLLQRLNAIRSALPEFRRGEARYQAVGSKPAVFAVLRRLPDKSSIGITSFLPKAIKTELDIPVEQLGFPSGSKVVLFNSWTGEKLGEGKLESFKKFVLELPAYGNAVLTWRPAGTPCPISAPEKLDYSVPAAKTLTLTESPLEIRVEGAKTLIVDKRNGLLKRFGDWLDGSTILSDRVPPNSPAQVSARMENGTAVITAKLAMGIVLCYTVKGATLEIKATLNDFSVTERSAFVLAATNAGRWQVNSIEGKLDDFIDKNTIDADFRSFLPQASATYRPVWSSILWHSELKPLDPSSPAVKVFGKNGKGFEIELASPLSTSYDDAMLLSKLPGRPGLHAAFFWVQPGPLSLADRKGPRSFRIMVRPVTQDASPRPMTFAGVKISHESFFWVLENEKYKLRLTRNGGTLKEMTAANGKTVISTQDIIAGKTLNNPVGKASLDLETGVRCYTENGKLNFRFVSALRNAGNHGVINPEIWTILDYVMDSSDTLRQEWSVYAEGLSLRREYYGRERIDSLRVAYVAQCAGKKLEIPVFKAPGEFRARQFYRFAAEISTGNGFTQASAPEMKITDLNWKRFFQLYSLAEGKQLPVMVASCFPGSSIVGWIQDTNTRLVQGYKAPAAVELRMPAWANIGPILDLPPGKYKMHTWIKGKDILRKDGGRAWVELRLIWTENGKELRRVKRFEIPEGSFDWQPFEAVLEIPKTALSPVSMILAPVLDGCESGTLWADLPDWAPVQ